jgi:hypothetical protein
MPHIDNYLEYLQEKEWSGDQGWEDHIDLFLLRNLLAKKDNLDQEELNQIRHTIQPMLIQIFKNAGGDYMGRETTKNSKSFDFSGMDWLEKYLPKDWQEKARKYIEKVARNHND